MCYTGCTGGKEVCVALAVPEVRVCVVLEVKGYVLCWR